MSHNSTCPELVILLRKLQLPMIPDCANQMRTTYKTCRSEGAPLLACTLATVVQVPFCICKRGHVITKSAWTIVDCSSPPIQPWTSVMVQMKEQQYTNINGSVIAMGIDPRLKGSRHDHVLARQVPLVHIVVTGAYSRAVKSPESAQCGLCNKCQRHWCLHERVSARAIQPM
jgi:hypothetical protein